MIFTKYTILTFITVTFSDITVLKLLKRYILGTFLVYISYAAQWKTWGLNTGKSNICDPVNYLTFTDFFRIVHKTKSTGS